MALPADQDDRGATNIFELGDHEHDSHLIVPIPLEDLTSELLEGVIGTAFLKRENEYYRGGEQIEPDIKLTYLAGTNTENLVGAKSQISGKPLYTKEVPPGTVKTDEVVEATSTIIVYNEQGKPATLVPAIVSEVSDLFYNLVHMKMLDPAFADSYQECMEYLAKVFGFTLNQALFVTAVKYNLRLFEQKGKKEVLKENAYIGKLMERSGEMEPLIPTPTDEQIQRVFEVMNDLKKGIWRSRLNQMITFANIKSMTDKLR